MTVLVLHNAVAPGAAADEADVLRQVALVEDGLRALGHRAVVESCGLDLECVPRSLSAHRPDVVFNLVESLGGCGMLQAVVPYLLETARVPYTGAPPDGLAASSHKTLAKRLLRDAGLATPAWCEADGPPPTPFVPGTYIRKHAWEHASFAMDDGFLFELACPQEAREILAAAAVRAPGPWFLERFVDGREFNLSVLGGAEGAQVLPCAEIRFLGYGDGRPRVVDYRAKWDEGSYEYNNTPRSFDFPASDASLLDDLRTLALACWDTFGLRGYARVDFRVDAAGTPWVLEVNTNPCLSPEAGFVAAAARAGLNRADLVGRILDAAARG
ncbi:MAG: D-alanine--D-alanine ligase [Lentisphaeria bacterium]|nr:D-alanine--D-alanine ligase [Lentisphaeria bacterium]